MEAESTRATLGSTLVEEMVRGTDTSSYKQILILVLFYFSW